MPIDLYLPYLVLDGEPVKTGGEIISKKGIIQKRVLSGPVSSFSKPAGGAMKLFKLKNISLETGCR
jgi:hypothetical protein